MSQLSQGKEKTGYYLSLVLIVIVSLVARIYIKEPVITYIDTVLKIAVFFYLVMIIRKEQADLKTASFLLTVFLFGRLFDVFNMTINNIDDVLKGVDNSFSLGKMIELLAATYLLYLTKKKIRSVK